MSKAIHSTNVAIAKMCDRKLTVIKTMTKNGPVYSFNETLELISREVAERLISKNIILPREESGQSFVLSAAWRAP